MSFNFGGLAQQLAQHQQQLQAEPWYSDYAQAYNQFMPSGSYDAFRSAVNQIGSKYNVGPGGGDLGDTAGKAIAASQAANDKGDFFDNLGLQFNPLKYGDALGLTRGPLSGRAPGKLTDQGINLQQIANPFVSRGALETANDVAPYVAGAIATMGGSAGAAPEGGLEAADAVPAAESAGPLQYADAATSTTDAPINWNAPPDTPADPWSTEPGFEPPVQQTAPWENDLGQSWGDAAGQSADQNATIGAVNGADGGGWADKLTGMGKWIEQNPTLSRLGLGAVMGGLSAYNSSQISKRNAKTSADLLSQQRTRQAQMDNPPAFGAMGGPGLTPSNNWGAGVGPRPTFGYNDLKNYGAGPEWRWAARGGLATHAPAHGGGLEQARMVDHPEGGGQDDNVPAMLSPKEYVLDADTVSSLGDGNPDEGARRLDEFRERLRTHKRAAPAHRIPPKARAIESYMRRAA